MFYKKDDSGYKKALDGVHYKSMALGEKTHILEFHLDKGSTIPNHSHPHEQTGYMVSGRMLFHIGGETFDAQTGDSWNIAGNVEHSVDVFEDAVVIEVFSPARQDYL
jgi:quercetin dioxygenase-like cupin family protein